MQKLYNYKLKNFFQLKQEKFIFSSDSTKGGQIDPALSIYFDLLRFTAALIVVLNHYGVLLSLARGTTFPGSDAVILFFVLSGYVIAYVSDRPGMNAKRYALDRLSRLWSVAMPAAILMFILGFLILWSGTKPENFGTGALDSLIIGSSVNVLFLGESWRQTFAPYNFPFWSVNYEAWYYIIFGLWLFMRGRGKIMAMIGACLLAGPSILIFMPIWLLGAALYRYRMKLRVSNPVACAMFVLSIVGYSAVYYFHLNVISRIWLKNITYGESYHLGPSTSIFSAYPIAFLVALNFIAVANMRLSRIILPPLEGVARKISSYTLTIYLFHMPLFFLFRATRIIPNDFDGKLFTYFLAGGAIIAIAQLTEHKRLAWRSALASAFSIGMNLVLLAREAMTAGRIMAVAPASAVSNYPNIRMNNAENSINK